MKKWYVSKVVLNTLILIMLIGFTAYLLRPQSLIQRFGLVIFLTGGTLVLVRGIVKITMGMRKSGQ